MLHIPLMSKQSEELYNALCRCWLPSAAAGQDKWQEYALLLIPEQHFTDELPSRSLGALGLNSTADELYETSPAARLQGQGAFCDDVREAGISLLKKPQLVYKSLFKIKMRHILHIYSCAGPQTGLRFIRK